MSASQRFLSVMVRSSRCLLCRVVYRGVGADLRFSTSTIQQPDVENLPTAPTSPMTDIHERSES